MATKKKGKGDKAAPSKKESKKPKAKKTSMTSKAAKPFLKGKKLKPAARGGIKCCEHCPDFEHCDEKAYCCDYCDFYLNGKCTFGKKKGIPSVNQEIELPNCRGDDFGIDDYEAYEQIYE